MKFNTLHEVLTDHIRDLYNAETQLVKALPKMAKAATSPDLRRAFEEHLAQTEKQVERLERVCEDLGIKPKGKTCKAMKGLIEEGKEVLSSTGDPAAKDAALIGAAQKVEHYEIAGYGTARTFAAVLGEQTAAELLQQTLDEEKATDERLTALAESGLNQEAAEEDAGDAPREDPLAARSTEEFDTDDEDAEDVEEAEMRTAEDDDSDAAAPSPRGQTATGDRRRVPAETVSRRGR
jgi:ferritin-like metal-binding protein YciE